MLRRYLQFVLTTGALVSLAACNHASAERAAQQAADSARAAGAPPAQVERAAEHARATVLAREGIKKPERHRAEVASGTTLHLASVTDITSQRNKAGDPFVARVTTAALSADGDTVIPVGAELVGRVTALESAPRNGDGTLTVAFSKLRVNGEERDIDVTVSRLGTRYVERGIDVEDAAKVGAGAAVGAVAGRVLGRNRGSAAAGAVVGGTAGAIYANRTKHRDIVISPGSTVEVVLQHDFSRDVVTR